MSFISQYGKIQLLSNDTWVIGRTGDGGAYAAVGSVGPIINIIIGFFLGLASGAEVVISQYFGAKDEDSVRKTVHTSMVLILILGVDIHYPRRCNGTLYA